MASSLVDIKLAPGGSALRLGAGKAGARRPKGRRVSFSRQLTTELRTPSPAKAPRSPPKIKLAALLEKRTAGSRIKKERAPVKRTKKAGKRVKKAGKRTKKAGKRTKKAGKRTKKAGKRVKKAGQAVKRGLRRRIDFSKIRWGTFTKRFVAWKRRHPRAKVNTLREFAAYVLAHPDKFSLRARRKALFYRNIILKGKVKMPIAKYHGRKSRTTLSRKAKTAKASRSRKAKRAKASRR
jgi:hypothetical protein